MNILITNDDGIHAAGLLALKDALAAAGRVTVVAPQRPQSATAHSITLHKPVRLEEAALSDGTPAWSCSGTPTDCVVLGLDVVRQGAVDLVFSGINSGPNLGWDVTYSGTVAAALEGAVLGLPAVAISLSSWEEPLDYSAAAEFALKLALRIAEHGLERWTLLNVNVPNLPAERIKGVRVTHQGRRQYVDRIDERVDPWGRKYYWLCGGLKEDAPDEGSDVHAILGEFISVTPIHLDLTAYAQLPRVEAWGL